MLNKLLKRCMPWMDKGRWYHVHINEDGSIIKDSIFDRVELSEDENTLIYFKPGLYYCVVDAKMFVSKIPPNFPQLSSEVYNATLPLIQVNNGPEVSYMDVYPFVPEFVVDYWFFLRPLER